MIALDAYALVAFMADEPARGEVADILRGSCVMSAVNLAESLDVLTRVHGVDQEEARGLIDPLLADAVEVAPASADDAWVVSSLRNRYYHRTARELSLADCFLLAAASKFDAAVATADPAVAATAADESLALIPLPDSAGVRPGQVESS